MSTNQKYLFCLLSLLVSCQALGMRQVTARTGAQAGRALGVGVAGTTTMRSYVNGKLFNLFG